MKDELRSRSPRVGDSRGKRGISGTESGEDEDKERTALSIPQRTEYLSC